MTIADTGCARAASGCPTVCDRWCSTSRRRTRRSITSRKSFPVYFRPSHIQALLSRENISTERRQARVQDRLQRQRILWRNRPAEFTFVINERALRLEVGDYRVMAEQLLAMLFFSDQRNITIRLVPSVARHHALFGGSFVCLGHERFSPLVYIEGALGGFFVEDAGYVAGYRSLLTDIAKVALDAEQSRLLIADLADQYDRAEGTWDDAWQVAQKQL